MPSYYEMSYWDTRFETEEQFEWLLDFMVLQKKVFPGLKMPATEGQPEDFVVLNAGCGTSRFGVDFAALYPAKVINVDYSVNVVNKMAAKYEHLAPLVTYRVDNLLTLSTIEPSSIDLIFDKSSLDALACSGQREVIVRYMTAIRKAVKPTGQWCCISYSDRAEWAAKDLWKLVWKEEVVVQEASESPARPAIMHWVHVFEPVLPEE